MAIIEAIAEKAAQASGSRLIDDLDYDIAFVSFQVMKSDRKRCPHY
jgi:hypothetical protein